MALIVYIKIQQQKYLGNYPSVDCSEHQNVSKQDVKFHLILNKNLIP